MNWIECLTESRTQYLDAGEFAFAREATGHISVFLLRQGLYRDLESINRDMHVYEEHPGPMRWIGRAYFDQGDYPQARKWYQRSLAAAGNELLEEASAAWHGLASIDLRVGDYNAARDKLKNPLATSQQIGDRAGEAATFYQLGIVAARLSRLLEGARLVALSFLINQSIGNIYTKSDLQALSQMSANLNYTQEQVDTMLREVSKAYEADRGAGLIQAAFKK